MVVLAPRDAPLLPPRSPVQLGHPLHLRPLTRVRALFAALGVVRDLRARLLHSPARALLLVALLVLARVADVPAVVAVAVPLVVFARLFSPPLRVARVHPRQLSHSPLQRRELLVLAVALTAVVVVDLV